MTDQEREELLAEGRGIMHGLWSELNDVMSAYGGNFERSVTNALHIEAAVALYRRHIERRLEEQGQLIARLEEAFEALQQEFGKK